MIRDALFCAGHPFQCITDSIPPWAWWVIGACVVLMLAGFVWRLAALAKAFGGTPAMVGALGIMGTLAAVFIGAFVKSRSEPADGGSVDHGTIPRPTPSRPSSPVPRPPREPLFPNAFWNKRGRR